jgi:radical SAM superfamily enzyme YgiQ (UPF0313 family)
MSYLEAKGYRTTLIPYAPNADERVVRTVLQAGDGPKLIGFSIIFQYNLGEFGNLMGALRRAGVRAHLTAGGHYPSLCPERTLRELPELDSVVRFEGEVTAGELLENVDCPEKWNGIQGLAFRQDGEIVINPARALVEDLDALPWPKRGDILQVVRGIPMAPMLASRGCLFNCSFCSIRQFYGAAPGPMRRSRSPQDVAAEMRALYDRRGVRLFLFQDDDFAAKTAQQRAWVDRFLLALNAEELTGKIGWKISSRVDDIEPEIMARCRDRGLLVVYLGVESGNVQGLTTLNKHATVEQNLRAMRTLRRLNIEFDMGFMMLDPDTTFATMRENLVFLRQVAELGGPPISFVKMLPLAGTAIETRLADEGRLTGDAIRRDYNFTDRRLDYYALWITLRFTNRNSHPDGLVETLRMAYFDHLVAQTFERPPWADEYGHEVRALIDLANGSALDTLERSLDVVEQCPDAESVAVRWRALNEISARDATIQREIFARLDRLTDRYSPALCSFLRGTERAAA